MSAKITRLTNLDTRGVAVVKRGANNKKIALFKGADGSDLTFEEMVLQVIQKGDMPLDEAAIDDMCAKAGCDPQMAETFKAIMKLSYVYRDSDTMKGLLKAAFGGPPGMPQPGAQPGMPQPGQQPMPGQQMPGANPMQQQPGMSATPGQPPMPAKAGDEGGDMGGDGAGKKPPFGKPKGEEAEGSAEEEQQDALGTEPGEGTPDEEAGDEPKKKNPFSKNAPGAKERDMDEKKVQELIAKAAADAKAEAEKKIADQEAIIKAQQTALDANTKAVTEMRDEMSKQKWVAKAAAELKYFPGKTAEELGSQLFDLEKVNADIAKSTFEAFKKTADTVQATSMFRAAGAGGPAPAPAGSAIAEMDKLISERVAKGDMTGMPREVQLAKAEAEVIKSHPELYKRYCDEQARLAKSAAN